MTVDANVRGGAVRRMLTGAMVALLVMASQAIPGLGDGAVSADAPVLIDPAMRSGASADRAAASCWEIKQLHPASTDGAYWLLTPSMSAPSRFWCDMTTDGGGWVRVAAARQQWFNSAEGRGDPAGLLVANPAPTVTIQLPSATIDELLNGGEVRSLPNGVRVRRSLNAAGTSWQEVRFTMPKQTGWQWAFGAENPVGTWTVGSSSGTGGYTYSFGTGQSTSRVDTSIQQAQNWTWGFAYGTSVTGTNDASTYLWGAAGSSGRARPYAEVYVRPRLTTNDVYFPSIGDTGTTAIAQLPLPRSTALVNPWGVSGIAGRVGYMSDVEVEALEQIGNVMYVGGNFRYVQRDQAGAGRVEQSFLAAFDATTGEYIPTFNPALNEQVRALTALPNGLLAVGGDFTLVNGQAVQGLVALNPSTGALDPTWGARIENGLNPGVVQVRALEISGSYLYLGGNFTHLSRRADGGGRVYARAAARVNVATGVPNAWNPEFNSSVRAIDAREDGSRIYFAGFFSTSRTFQTPYAAAVHPDAAATLDPWTPTWSQTGQTYQQTILSTDDSVWVGGAEHSWFQFDAETYARGVGHIANPKGDFQASTRSNGIMYATCHCWDFLYQGSYTWPSVGTGWTRATGINGIGAWDEATGRHLEAFKPETSQRAGSGPWAVKIASDGTLWMGGDIVGGRTGSGNRWLGGFARYPQRDATPPNAPSNLRANQQTAATVTLAWNASPGGGVAGYHILRDDRVIAVTTGTGTTATVPKYGANRFFVRAYDAAGNVSASTPVFETGDGNPNPVATIQHSQTGPTTVEFDATGSTDDGEITQYYWEFGDGATSDAAVVEHTYATTGEYTVGLTVVDDRGGYSRLEQTVNVQLPAPTDMYGSAVMEDSPFLYWRLNEPSGAFAHDQSGNGRPGSYLGTVGRSVAGALSSTGDQAARFNGSNAYVVAAGTPVSNPGAFSTEIWFRSTSTQGGKLIGFGTASSGLSSSYDRHVFLQNNEQLVFGVYVNGEYRVTSPGSYRDGQWHHVVATQGADGMRLYVDGVLVGSNSQASAENYTGYWRIGGDRVWSGANSSYLNGDLDEAAVYSYALSAEQVAAHYAAGTWVAPNEPPTAQIDEVAVDGLTVSVAGSATDSDGSVVSYEWDFGDGSEPVAGATAAHSYAASGTYTVKLTATDDDGDVGTAEEVISVLAPNVLPTVEIVDVVIDGLTVSVVGAGSDTDGEIVEYLWEFGDGGTAATASAEHTFGADGTYTLTLTATDDRGGTAVATTEVSVAAPNLPPVAEIDVESVDLLDIVVNASGSTDPDGSIVSYVWDFGDGSEQVSGATASHTYAADGTYIVTLTVTDDDGDTGVATTELTVSATPPPNQVPVAVIDDVVTDGLAVSVGGSDSVDPDGSIVSYVWDFGDDSDEVSGATASHTYAAGGTYIVTLTVTDDDGATGVATTEVTVTAPNQVPVAVIDDVVSSGLAVSVGGSGSFDPDGSIVSYVWDFGDGSDEVSGATASYTYAEAGTYSVTLTVTDNRGATGSVNASVTVAESGEPVTSTVIERGAVWSWYYAAAAPQANWRELGANLSSWQTGAAPLGFGFTGVATNIDVPPPTSNRPLAAYFVRTFQVANPAAVVSLTLNTVSDDGVIVHVNGVEVARENVQAGTNTHGLYALSPYRTNVAPPVVIEVPTSLLVAGTNVVAVSTHVNWRATPDISFDLDAQLTTAS